MFLKPALIFLWFILTPLVLTASILNLTSLRKVENAKLASELSDLDANSSNHLNPQVLGVEVDDFRPYIVENFLKDTILSSYSKYIIEVSDKYDLDFRLIPAIAMKETGGGNRARVGSFNAWGFENGRTNFNSWEDAIDTVGKTLKEKYADRGLVSPEQIMPVYAPPQLLTGGKWAKDIRYFFSQMQIL